MIINSTVKYFIVSGVFTLFAAIPACKDISETKEQFSTITDKKMERVEKSRVVVEKADIETLRRGITTFNATNGRYPNNLDELKEFVAIDFDKGIFNYNPQTGTLALKQ
ncbi:MAG: hypothetical protein HQL06_05825 [Nitrospirae bacterium]|nr:hypothetical protein [Nitrospirota bacterium]